MRDRLRNTVAAALDRIGLQRDELILLALSGGADSVALFHALLALRERFDYRIAAAHFNHHLRADESDRDEAFVRALCAQVGVELVVGHADRLGGPNLEERARESRYEFLHSAADRLEASRVALAHHGDDQAETVLYRLLRGAGAAGLGAMAESGPGRLIRPMLALERREILNYLNTIGAGFVTDSTNASPEIVRNRLRAELIPTLERDYAPGLRRRLGELAAEMRSLDDFLTTIADAELDQSLAPDGALDLVRFAMLHPALAGAVMRALIRRRTGSLRRLTRPHIEAMRRLALEGPANGAVDLPGGWRAEREYGLLRLRESSPRARPEFLVPIAFEGTTVLPAAGVAFEGTAMDTADAALPPNPLVALFDADQIASGLAARNFVEGDRIRPLGMEGTRKVKQVFIDQKVPRARRAALPLVVNGGEVVWIPGLIRGGGAVVTARTVRVVRLTAKLAIL
jgi:tRNA(Ile)-lysidine synthase